MDVNPSKSAGIKVEIAYGSPDALLAHAVIVAADPFAPLPTVQVNYTVHVQYKEDMHQSRHLLSFSS